MVMGGVGFELVRFKGTMVVYGDRITGSNTTLGLLIEELFGYHFYDKGE